MSQDFSVRPRIAPNDNLLKQCTLPEIRMVMAQRDGPLRGLITVRQNWLTYFGIYYSVVGIRP